MKLNPFKRIAAYFRSIITKRNYEWLLASNYRKIDTNNIDVRRDVSITHL